MSSGPIIFRVRRPLCAVYLRGQSGGSIAKPDLEAIALMRVLMVSKACLTGTYQSKLTAIGQHPDVELAVMVPAFWDDPAGRIELERQHTDGYQLWVEPLRFNGNYHFHYWPTLRRRIAEFQPDIIHMDEEPYNLATWLGLNAARRAGAKFLFFSWQNIYRQYPFPFSWMEQQVLSQSDFALMGNREAAEVFQKKGYKNRQAIVPQFGTDPETFKPAADRHGQLAERFKIGFAGRLIVGKGVDVLLRAAAQLPDTFDWHLEIAGEGPKENSLRNLAEKLGIADRVSFRGRMGSAEMPAFIQGLDLLVLPSRTLSSWKEQFGRILVEAMASGVPVIGSNSGEIPHVIGDAGLIFNEEDADGLASAIKMLLADSDKRASFAELGRERALSTFTQEQIAADTITVYKQLL